MYHDKIVQNSLSPLFYAQRNSPYNNFNIKKKIYSLAPKKFYAQQFYSKIQQKKVQL